ncbi:hypothetical protein GCM10010171_26670 [Actinokineospora fastidiosa]|uniref:Uncharacterized protein n=1 Tax=Actinokineospora fastidiosa TaxID=1816 RepID=A0A918GEV7_9PSEU|nr:hypothetical protein GCM10010171_26670 [Actinokineospora fastidiosa]
MGSEAVLPFLGADGFAAPPLIRAAPLRLGAPQKRIHPIGHQVSNRVAHGLSAALALRDRHRTAGALPQVGARLSSAAAGRLGGSRVAFLVRWGGPAFAGPLSEAARA